jgi:hypothetical protein
VNKPEEKGDQRGSTNLNSKEGSSKREPQTEKKREGEEMR